MNQFYQSNLERVEKDQILALKKYELYNKLT